MSVFDHREFRDHEQVVFWNDRRAGLKAILAVHSTIRGPALGGCRMWPYASDAQALTDVLRLSRGMTFKSALARLPLGGGKSVIIGDPHRDKTPMLMEAMGRAVESLGGRYIAAEDSGTSVPDLQCMAKVTRHVGGVAEVTGWDGRMRNGDPSPATAYGCFVGIQSAVRHRLGRDSLEGVSVAIQGVGNVGRQLAELLDRAGATLYVSDLQSDQVRYVVERNGAIPVSGDRLLDLEVDVFAPCAMGGVLNDATIPRLRASIVAGSANNQLAEARHGDALAERGILYAPDYAINAGGIIDVASEHEGYDPRLVRRRLDEIGTTLDAIFRRACERAESTHRIADELALQRLHTEADPMVVRVAA